MNLVIKLDPISFRPDGSLEEEGMVEKGSVISKLKSYLMKKASH